MRLPARGGMDTELVRRAQDGDREAFAALVPPAVDRLLPVAFQILGDPDLAEEATHVAVINAWRKFPSLREPARFEAWLYRLVVNACRDEVRRRPWEVHASVPLTWPSTGRAGAAGRRPRSARSGVSSTVGRSPGGDRAPPPCRPAPVEVGRALGVPPERSVRASTTRRARCATRSSSTTSCQTAQVIA